MAPEADLSLLGLFLCARQVHGGKKKYKKFDLQAICLTVLVITRGSDVSMRVAGVNRSMDQWINR